MGQKHEQDGRPEEVETVRCRRLQALADVATSLPTDPSTIDRYDEDTSMISDATIAKGIPCTNLLLRPIPLRNYRDVIRLADFCRVLGVHGSMFALKLGIAE